MNGLYKRVLKGQYPPIDRSAYSQSLIKVVSAMLRVDSKARPSCADILETDFVRDKCNEYAVDLSDEPVAPYNDQNNDDPNNQSSSAA